MHACAHFPKQIDNIVLLLHCKNQTIDESSYNVKLFEFFFFYCRNKSSIN